MNTVNLSPNPWCTISPTDYDGHMGHPSVNQTRLLCDVFGDALSKCSAQSVAMLGCATGNGLEHIAKKRTRRVTVVDINKLFLEKLAEKYGAQIHGLDVRHDDLNHIRLDKNAYSLVFAGLVFEFVDWQSLLKKVSGWLIQNGALSVVLQCPSETLPDVSSSPYPSLKKVGALFNMIHPDVFGAECGQLGLCARETEYITLASGKSFYIGTYVKKTTTAPL
ncbi:MAG: class I SAM-dependent methyltransferase [Deltaproteobacteria bacterium]|nr:class I SAM-dependent methyltransferase [Deltaproteobacteria bacterium]